MKLNKFTSFILILCISCVCIISCGFTFFKKSNNNVLNTAKAQVSQDYSTIKNSLWCVTFQLVWNDFMDKFNKGNPIEFVGGNPPIADELNKKLYTSDILSNESYYKVQDVISTKLKKQIEKDIKKKFNEKSDIIDLINWKAKNSYLFYAMLKKDFNFLYPFDELIAAPFSGSVENVKYFGIDKKSENKLKKNVDVLFYNSADEYAVKLFTKENEEIVLLRTDNDDSFENLYAYVVNNTKKDSLKKEDTIKVPNLNVDKMISYNELCGKKIKDSKYIITDAMQTIKFKMDNKGGSLKSEAALVVMKMSLLPPDLDKQRNFNFDKKFILFLKESGKDKPYYAMKVDNTEFLVKE